VLNEEVLARAFNGCFLEENPDEQAPDTPIMPMASSTCSDYWAEKVASIETSFGVLAMLATAWDAETKQYKHEDCERQFGAAETTRVMLQLHHQYFTQWRALGRDRQVRDMGKYLETATVTSTVLKNQLKEWVGVLMPAGSDIEDTCLFTHDLAMVLETLSPSVVKAEAVEFPAQMAMQRTA